MTRRTNPHDPTDERTSDMSTPTASGLSGGRSERRDDRAGEEEPVPRDGDRRGAPPRRYEQPASEDPAMPSDDAALGTKI